ncbi:nucleoporin-interacting protein NIC96 [Hysterangium stoloniferum]|nr:nucleoporin-interacting protein NIC96 [Hysterangium stoloniferum]
MATNDLASILTSSRALNAHLQTRPDLPTVNLGLDQVELQSRRLVNRYAGASSADTGRANYLLAQAHVDAPSLATSIAALNTSTTFSPLQPLLDTDVAGYLRHAHEQTLISTIEEGRRETETEFYQVLEERVRRDWESRKKRIFDELGGRGFAVESSRSPSDLHISSRGSMLQSLSASSFTPSLQMHQKMMAYDRVISELTVARIGGVSYPVVHSLLGAVRSVGGDSSNQIQEILHILTKITKEPPALPRQSHGGAHLLNMPIYDRKYARAYLGDENSREAVDLRIQIAHGSKAALEEQYWEVLERTIASNPSQAALGGDPSAANRVRAYLAVRFYRNGQWDERLELLNGRPLWAQLFYLLRTGHAEDAVELALKNKSTLDSRQRDFCGQFQKWVLSEDKNIVDANRNTFRTHLEHSPTVDPFKAALFKLMGRVEPHTRNVPYVTGTTEDWLWFQLAMINETGANNEANGLRELVEVLMGYGEQHFEPPSAQKSAASKHGTWARVLLICGQFERAVAALYERPESQAEAVHLSIALAYHGLLRVTPKVEATDGTILTTSYNRRASLNLALVIARYIRQFTRTDPKEAIQYVYCVGLGADQGEGVGQEQIEMAWDLCRKVIVTAEASGGWEELVGGFRPDGIKFNGELERGLPLLKLDKQKYYEVILRPAAKQSEREKRINEAIKLYNLADSPDTVIACLARELSELIDEPDNGGHPGAELAQTARDILRHYERTNKGAGKAKDAVIKLLKIRDAKEAKENGNLEAALQAIESSGLVPLDGDITTITKRAEEFKDHDDAITRNLHVFLPLTMDILHRQHEIIKRSVYSDSGRQATLVALRTKSRSLMVFAGMLKYRMSADIYAHLARMDVDIAL